MDINVSSSTSQLSSKKPKEITNNITHINLLSIKKGIGKIRLHQKPV